MGADLTGTLTLDGTAKIQNYGGTTILSGAIGVTNPTDLLVVGGGTSGSTQIFTGTNNAAGAASLNQIWVNSGGSGAGIDVLQIGNNGTAGTLGLGNVILHADAAKTAAAAPKAAASAPRLSGKDKELEDKKKQAEAAEAAKKKAEEERLAKARADNCERAKRAKASMDSGMRIATTNAKGERDFMTDAARAAESKRLGEIMAAECGPAPKL